MPITYVRVEFGKFKVQDFRKITNHLEKSIKYAQGNKENPKYHNMQLVGLGNTRILTDYAQKPPWTLIKKGVKSPKLETNVRGDIVL